VARTALTTEKKPFTAQAQATYCSRCGVGDATQSEGHEGTEAQAEGGEAGDGEKRTQRQRCSDEEVYEPADAELVEEGEHGQRGEQDQQCPVAMLRVVPAQQTPDAREDEQREERDGERVGMVSE